VRLMSVIGLQRLRAGVGVHARCVRPPRRIGRCILSASTFPFGDLGGLIGYFCCAAVYAGRPAFDVKNSRASGSARRFWIGIVWKLPIRFHRLESNASNAVLITSRAPRGRSSRVDPADDASANTLCGCSPSCSPDCGDRLGSWSQIRGWPTRFWPSCAMIACIALSFGLLSWRVALKSVPFWNCLFFVER